MGDGFYQALAHPIRREIIRLLKWSDLSAGEIANNFNISKPSISRHLEVLKNTEIIVGTLHYLPFFSHFSLLFYSLFSF